MKVEWSAVTVECRVDSMTPAGLIMAIDYNVFRLLENLRTSN
jgi:hypothetical protein